MNSMGAFSRTEALEQLSANQFDVLVIGGGITGAGVLLDAAARGLRAALVEKDDFASGTSSESSKLVHGGLRYLQQHEVGLVFQSLAERQILLRNAPHLVRPQMFVIPLFGSGGVLDRTMARTYSVALWLYDLFGGFRIGHLHRKLTAQEVQAHLPTLRVDNLVAGFVYYDAHADDARLTLDILRTAVMDEGAVALNHAAVVGLTKDGAGAVTGAKVVVEGQPDRSIDVRARVVVNATGVWADEVRDLDAEGQRTIRPAKGVHIAVPGEKLPCDAAVVLPAQHGRNVFVIPWDGTTYVGTTDTDYEGDLDHPGVERADVDYLLDAVNAAVTQPVQPSDITGTWSGLRPLLAKGSRWRRRPRARTADLSRRHKVLVSPSGLITITGGKLTTYRKMADDTVSVVVRRLGKGRKRCLTKHLVLRGARGVEALRAPGAATRLGLSPVTFDHLVGRYGAETPAVAEVMAEDARLAEPLVPTLPFVGGEVVYAVRHEMATHLDDVLSHRLRVLGFDARTALTMARPAAGLMGEELQWTDDRRQRELDRFAALAAESLSMLAADEDGAAGGGAPAFDSR
ncbi:MAG TPA: glycerol-3-phosphate dehydrogenase/oxidase [Acidimicrobiales bacterium]|nr:glycerol-3-phosphate dehydrogenase/oxidase [Acidimicrobiales bacterium]